MLSRNGGGDNSVQDVQSVPRGLHNCELMEAATLMGLSSQEGTEVSLLSLLGERKTHREAWTCAEAWKAGLIYGNFLPAHLQKKRSCRLYMPLHRRAVGNKCQSKKGTVYPQPFFHTENYNPHGNILFE